MIKPNPTHAGGVVYRINKNNVPEFLIVTAKKNKSEWVLPKGHIEDGEDPTQTAIREIEEESGIKSSLCEFFKEPIGYSEYRNDKDEDCKVVYYLMEYKSHGEQVDDRQVKLVKIDYFTGLDIFFDVIYKAYWIIYNHFQIYKHDWFKGKYKEFKNDLEYIYEGKVLDIIEQISKRLKELGWSNKEFASKLNKYHTWVDGFLDGRGNYSLKTLVIISEVLGMNIYVEFLKKENSCDNFTDDTDLLVKEK